MTLIAQITVVAVLIIELIAVPGYIVQAKAGSAVASVIAALGLFVAALVLFGVVQ